MQNIIRPLRVSFPFLHSHTLRPRYGLQRPLFSTLSDNVSNKSSMLEAKASSPADPLVLSLSRTKSKAKDKIIAAIQPPVESSLHQPSPRQPVEQPEEYRIYTDASDWGIGLVINDAWYHWQWSPKFKKEQLGSISTQRKESIGVEVALKVALYFSKTHRVPVPNITPPMDLELITIYSDNRTISQIWKKGSSPKDDLNEWVERLRTGLRLNITNSPRNLDTRILLLNYISGKANPADGPSRGRKGDGIFMPNWHCALDRRLLLMLSPVFDAHIIFIAVYFIVMV